eukprot:356793-Chlamydomonas_euryale.AAC.1
MPPTAHGCRSPPETVQNNEQSTETALSSSPNGHCACAFGTCAWKGRTAASTACILPAVSHERCMTRTTNRSDGPLSPSGAHVRRCGAPCPHVSGARTETCPHMLGAHIACAAHLCDVDHVTRQRQALELEVGNVCLRVRRRESGVVWGTCGQARDEEAIAYELTLETYARKSGKRLNNPHLATQKIGFPNVYATT